MRIVFATAMVLAGLLLAACGDDDETTGGEATEAAVGTELNVTLKEFEVIVETVASGDKADSAPAGEVLFNVENTGPNDVHELVIVKTDLDADALPTLADGSVDETGEGVEVIDEIEDIPVGETQSLSVDLDAGAYVLICNIFDETENEAHYAEGMRTAFTVE